MSEKKSQSRRGFFTALGAVAAAGAAIKLSSSAPVTVSSESPKPTGDGYQLSEHVKKYYRSTTL